MQVTGVVRGNHVAVTGQEGDMGIDDVVRPGASAQGAEWSRYVVIQTVLLDACEQARQEGLASAARSPGLRDAPR
ncbi:MAG: hypothetical protein ACRD2W_02900 [Acidimicrobiales bacterium]